MPPTEPDKIDDKLCENIDEDLQTKEREGDEKTRGRPFQAGQSGNPAGRPHGAGRFPP